MKKYNGKVININATAAKVGDKCYDLLAVLALSCCDTVSYLGKKSAVNLMLKLDLNLRMFSDSAAQKHEWMRVGMEFLSYLYNGNIVESLSNLRYTLFSNWKEPQLMRPQQSMSSSAHLESLLPAGARVSYSCRSESLPCTTYCNCKAEEQCF
jgi:hypothetical protein